MSIRKVNLCNEMSDRVHRELIRASWLGKLPSEGTNLSNALTKLGGQLPLKLRDTPLRAVRSLGLPRNYWFELYAFQDVKINGKANERRDISLSWYDKEQPHEGVDEVSPSRQEHGLLGTISLANVLALHDGVATPGIANPEDAAKREVCIFSCMG